MAYKVYDPKAWTPSIGGHYALGIDGELYTVLNGEKTWSFSTTDDDTMRFEVRAGDAFWWDAAYGDAANRSEIAEVNTIKDGTPTDISYQFQIEPGAKNTAYWMAIGQLHQDTDANNAPWGPPFDIGMQGEKMTIDIKYTGADGNPVSVRLFTDVTDIQRGHYYSMQIKTVLDPSGNGRLVVIRDGVTLADYSGPLGYTSETGVNWKEGVYRSNNATETIAADYRNLAITTGSTVTFPDKSAFIAAPDMSVASVSSNTDGSRTFNLTGTAKIGSTVSIMENGVVVGTAVANAAGAFSIGIKEASGAQHLLSAYATDATGKTGLTSAPLAVEIGTAADIVSRMPTIAAEKVGAIVLTDTQVLTITSATQMSTLMNAEKAATSKIQGSYSFLLTSKVTGQPYDTQNTFYTSAGVLTERLRYAAGKLVFDESIASDGSSVVKSLNSLGGFDVGTIATDGFMTAFAHNTTSGVPNFTQTFGRDGSKSIHYYNAAGQQVNFTLFNADKSSENVTLGITGQSYAIQAFSYNASGQMILQQRFTAAGLLVSQTATSSNGTREISSYDPISGRETSYTIYNTDGSKVQGTYGITGQSYTAQVVNYNAAGKITGQTTSNATGPIPSASAIILKAIAAPAAVATSSTAASSTAASTAPANSTSTSASASSATPSSTTASSTTPSSSPSSSTGANSTATSTTTGGTHTNSDGSSTVTTYQPGSTSLLASVKSYNAAGKLTETDTYNTAGHKISVDVIGTGSDVLTTFDPSSGFATQAVKTNSDGSKLVTAYQAGSGALIASVKAYNAAGTLTEVDAYNAAGQKISTDVIDTGGDVLTTFDVSSGLATQAVTTASDGSKVVTAYQAGSASLIASVKAYNPAGTLIEVDAYNAAGQKISTDVIGTGTDLLTKLDPATGRATQSVQTTANAKGSLINTYNAAGVLIASQFAGKDGSQKVFTFDAKTGLENGYVLTQADNSKTIATFTPGNKAALLTKSIYDATGKLTETDGFNASGQKVSAHLWFSNGAHGTATYDPTSGALLQSSTYNTDGTRTDQNNAVVGKPYAEQIATYVHSTGALVSVARYYGDANHTLAFTAVANKDGSSAASSYDTAGRQVSSIVTGSDGSKDVVTSTYAGTGTTPATVQQDHYTSGNQKAWTDITQADGTHKQTAFVAGAILTGHAAVADSFTSAKSGSDSFVFAPAFGQDLVTNFHAGAGAGHDTIDLRSLKLGRSAGQSSMDVLAHALKQVGGDAVLTITPTDTITMKNTLVSSLTKEDFLV